MRPATLHRPGRQLVVPSGGDWTPSDLWDAGQVGGWIDFTDPSGLYSESGGGGTNPSSEDDPIKSFLLREDGQFVSGRFSGELWYWRMAGPYCDGRVSINPFMSYSTITSTAATPMFSLTAFNMDSLDSTQYANGHYANNSSTGLNFHVGRRNSTTIGIFGPHYRLEAATDLGDRWVVIQHQYDPSAGSTGMGSAWLNGYDSGAEIELLTDDGDADNTMGTFADEYNPTGAENGTYAPNAYWAATIYIQKVLTAQERQDAYSWALARIPA